MPRLFPLLAALSLCLLLLSCMDANPIAHASYCYDNIWVVRVYADGSVEWTKAMTTDDVEQMRSPGTKDMPFPEQKKGQIPADEAEELFRQIKKSGFTEAYGTSYGINRYAGLVLRFKDGRKLANYGPRPDAPSGELAKMAPIERAFHQIYESVAGATNARKFYKRGKDSGI